MERGVFAIFMFWSLKSGILSGLEFKFEVLNCRMRVVS
jgi:hypothetical protein